MARLAVDSRPILHTHPVADPEVRLAGPAVDSGSAGDAHITGLVRATPKGVGLAVALDHGANLAAIRFVRCARCAAAGVECRTSTESESKVVAGIFSLQPLLDTHQYLAVQAAQLPPVMFV